MTQPPADATRRRLDEALRLIRVLLDRIEYGEFDAIDGEQMVARKSHMCVRCGYWIHVSDLIVQARWANRSWWVHNMCPHLEDALEMLRGDDLGHLVTDSQTSTYHMTCIWCRQSIEPGDEVALVRRPGRLPPVGRHSYWVHSHHVSTDQRSST